MQERRNSTAAKIIIGRDEIDRYGDSTLGDVLKRLPGVTIQGRPGRGGAIRMRGLGNGYTQILLDGERIPPGFSLDSLTPDQIERIEILRAPTAETGARAIAGTINIITRGGYSKRVNDVKLTTGYENGSVQPSLSWTRNIASGPFIVNYSLTGFHYDRDTSSSTSTVDRLLDTDALSLDQEARSHSRSQGNGLHATGRLQWKGEGANADSVTLTPILVYSRFRSRSDGTLTQSIGPIPVPYDDLTTSGRFANTFGRLNGEWTHRLAGGGRIETRAGYGQTRQNSRSFRHESGGATPFDQDDDSRTTDTGTTASAKLVETIFEDHSLVSGFEFQRDRDNNRRITLQNGVPTLTEFGDNLTASETRFAGYAQDEWNITPTLAAHAGLRWEGITTRGSALVGQPDVSNRSSVWTPLLHGVWKPDPKSRDQVRLSLTRSYRSPTLSSLIARPSVNGRYPVIDPNTGMLSQTPNTPTQPDRAGNPNLKPELATGIDLAVERYLAGSGLISANLFRRDLSNYMRGVTTRETVSYAAVPRYVLRQQNVGKAVTEGAELETKFRASDLWPEAPKIDVRANAAFFRSRVKGVPGPDNRLDQQPDYTANLGGDYRFGRWPLTVGGNLNWTPGYTTRISDVQTASISGKLVGDIYALWVFNPAFQMRLTASNFAPRDYVTGSSVDGPDVLGRNVRETSLTSGPTFVNLQLRLEMKL